MKDNLIRSLLKSSLARFGYNKIYGVDAPNVVHVLPCNDLIEHEYDDCVCVPSIEEVEVSGRVFVHNALDGRE